jgi:hypothetical protein
VQRVLDLRGHRVADLLAEVRGQRPGLPGHRGGELAPLPAELTQLVTGHRRLRLAQRGTELEDLLHLPGLVADQHVHHPGGGRRLRELLHLRGEPLVGLLGLGGELVAARHELLGAQPVELLGRRHQVHGPEHRFPGSYAVAPRQSPEPPQTNRGGPEVSGGSAPGR